jgi:hypothetical protein
MFPFLHYSYNEKGNIAKMVFSQFFTEKSLKV